MAERAGERGLFARLQAWTKANMPTRESLEGNRYIRPVAHRVLAPELWRFTRRSVPRGVAIGLLVGIFLMIPGLQIVGAALLCVPWRGNIPIAALMTFLSNPVTTPFILLMSLFVGNDLLGFTANMETFGKLSRENASLADYARWLMSDAAPAVLAGLGIIAVATAVVGFVLAVGFWRLWVARKWQRRSARAIDAA